MRLPQKPRGGARAVRQARAGATGDESSSFTAHALQHALLAMVAPLLLALGGPVTLALQATARPTQVGLLRLIHARPVAVLTSPVVALRVNAPPSAVDRPTTAFSELALAI